MVQRAACRDHHRKQGKQFLKLKIQLSAHARLPLGAHTPGKISAHGDHSGPAEQRRDRGQEPQVLALPRFALSTDG